MDLTKQPEQPEQQNYQDEQQERQWAMYLHLSQLGGFIFPLVGLIAPILIWQLKKEQYPSLEEHGKAVVNWMISELIYAVICFVLIFIIIGFPLLFVLGLLGIIFPIIGGIKANNGELWHYPMSITIVK